MNYKKTWNQWRLFDAAFQYCNNTHLTSSQKSEPSYCFPRFDFLTTPEFDIEFLVSNHLGIWTSAFVCYQPLVQIVSIYVLLLVDILHKMSAGNPRHIQDPTLLSKILQMEILRHMMEARDDLFGEKKVTKKCWRKKIQLFKKLSLRCYQFMSISIASKLLIIVSF